ncbi:hypothetical protein CAPTEDRAFT_200713 [Capitella teleta]|uniref:DDE Tnp4 domain-containing protein n=1 Tax=Capitella teleta TaxID=283909 RepID=R7UZ59_CAPTE|nr:hypothetical protein CAPTEDRAFT_200713 [Capitella teleta]|eukprot:ELU09237.1 hypothetical protein CAPTEDRAFT_200713 [Capitella teleta]
MGRIKTMLLYLLWRVQNGLNTTININFMMEGHTKFAVDWGFGLVKRKFRQTRVDCQEDIKSVVDESLFVNTAVMMGDEAGNVDVPIIQSSYLLPHKFHKIVECHYLWFKGTHLDVVFARNFFNSEEFEVYS